MNQIRNFLSKALLTSAYIIAPSYMKPIIEYIIKALAGLPREIERGRNGGIIVAPWSITSNGKLLSNKQLVEAMVVAEKVRKENPTLGVVDVIAMDSDISYCWGRSCFPSFIFRTVS